MTTIKDIARMADVSKSTVSKVINDYPGINKETRKKILKIMEENNYFPNATARSLSTKISKTIGIFDPGRLNNFFFRDVMEGIEDYLGKKGFNILYFTNKAWGETWVNFSFTEKARNRNVDGVLMMGFGDIDLAQFKKLVQSSIPAVFIDIELEGKRTTYITSDNAAGARSAVEYLYKKGHKKIGIIRGPYGFKPADKRFKGYREKLNELGLTYIPDWVFSREYFQREGKKCINSFLKMSDLPTAFFCQDIFAVGAIKELQKRGYRIPEDFSFVGFDDIELSEHYGLTTIRQKKEKIGREAARTLLNIIYDEEFSPVIVPTELVERSSCKKID